MGSPACPCIVFCTPRPTRTSSSSPSRALGTPQAVDRPLPLTQRSLSLPAPPRSGRHSIYDGSMTTAQLEKENVRDVTPPPAPASAGAVLAGTPNSSGRSSGRKRRPGCDAVLHAGNEQAKALSDPPTKRWRAAPPSPAPPLWQTEESPAAAAASVGQQAKQQQPLGEGAARPATGSLDLEQQEAAQVPSPAEGGSKREVGGHAQGAAPRERRCPCHEYDSAQAPMQPFCTTDTPDVRLRPTALCAGAHT